MLHISYTFEQWNYLVFLLSRATEAPHKLWMRSAQTPQRANDLGTTHSLLSFSGSVQPEVSVSTSHWTTRLGFKDPVNVHRLDWWSSYHIVIQKTTACAFKFFGGPIFLETSLAKLGEFLTTFHTIPFLIFPLGVGGNPVNYFPSKLAGGQLVKVTEVNVEDMHNELLFLKPIEEVLNHGIAVFLIWLSASSGVRSSGEGRLTQSLRWW